MSPVLRPARGHHQEEPQRSCDGGARRYDFGEPQPRILHPHPRRRLEVRGLGSTSYTRVGPGRDVRQVQLRGLR
eukprot:2770693-Heterocapsa_arctica.AAC.1